MNVEIPDKIYFKIGEVSRIADVKPYVLRYWESEFPSIRPTKSKSNQRLYQRKDIEAILEVKHLLYEKRFTIDGARSYIRSSSSSSPTDDSSGFNDWTLLKEELLGIRLKLQAVRDLLQNS